MTDLSRGNAESEADQDLQNRQTLVLSACLAGRRCAYDGGAANQEVRVAGSDEVVLVCPEVLGGLSTPRPRAEIVGGDGFDVLDGKARVVTHTGQDVTEAYLAGAEESLRLALRSGASEAVLQDFSPSCGCRQINDGSFHKRRVRGVGVTTALLLRNGFSVIPHHEYHADDRPHRRSS